jgi:rhodanese-related sulfurtransferase
MLAVAAVFAGMVGCVVAMPLTPPSPATSPTAKAEWDPPMLKPAEVRARQQQGEVFVPVDVRAAEAYADEHIEGAVNMPRKRLLQGPGALSRDQHLLLYCTCGDDSESLNGAYILHDDHGFTKVSVLKGGMWPWKEAGYPMTGAKK